MHPTTAHVETPSSGTKPSHGARQSAWPRRRRKRELTADGPRRTDRYLAMTRNRRTEIDRRVPPDRMVGALAEHLTAMIDEMAFELLPLHAAARSIVTCSA